MLAHRPRVFACRFGAPLLMTRVGPKREPPLHSVRRGGVVLTACPEVEAMGWYPSCAGLTGSVTFQNMGTTPLYVALMRADKTGALSCHRDNSPLGFEVEIRPEEIPPYDPNSKGGEKKLLYCRGGSGDLYLVWWPTKPNPSQPTSLSAAKPRIAPISFNPFRGIIKIQE
jgi:hypothetical protein